LFKEANTPGAMAKLGVAGLENYIKRIGLFRTKAKNVIALSQMLLDKHCGAGAAEPRGARGAAGRRPQDRERGG
jgi:endonuclease-3